MSAIKNHLFEKFDTIECILEGFPNLEVTYLVRGALVEGGEELIECFMSEVRAVQDPQIVMHHSGLFPDCVAISFNL